MSERWIAASRSASEAAASVSIEPQPRKLSRDPATSITPHPVVRRPGSTPRMRIAAMVMQRLIYEFPRPRIRAVRPYRRRFEPSEPANPRSRFRRHSPCASWLAGRACDSLVTKQAGAIRGGRGEVGEEADGLAAPLADTPHFEFEREAFASGHRWVAGVDEVGRGPLAGPVGVAAVILDPDDLPFRGSTIPRSLHRGPARWIRCEIIFAKAISVSIVFASVDEIDP